MPLQLGPLPSKSAAHFIFVHGAKIIKKKSEESEDDLGRIYGMAGKYRRSLEKCVWTRGLADGNVHSSIDALDKKTPL